MTRWWVTGGTGFIGREVLRCLGQRDDVEVVALARSDASAAQVEAAGARALRGDLGVDGDWVASLREADVVLHMAQPQAWGQKVTEAVARRWEAQRLDQEARLLGAVPDGVRVVYVSGSSSYGDTGLEPTDEDGPRRPCGWGPYQLAPEAQAEAHGGRLDLVIAHPSAVYGAGSWFEESILQPLARGRRLVQLIGHDPWFSPIHVTDAAGALVHLGEVEAEALDRLGRRVLLADDEPMPAAELARLAAEALGTEVRGLPLPGFLVRWAAGEVVRSYLASSSVFRNDRLKALGYAFRFPTARKGVPDVVSGWQAGQPGPAGPPLAL